MVFQYVLKNLEDEQAARQLGLLYLTLIKL